MHQSDKVGYYGQPNNYQEYPSQDHDFFYSQNKNKNKNQIQLQPEPYPYGANWNQNINKHTPQGINPGNPKNLFDFMQNNLGEHLGNKQPFQAENHQKNRGPTTQEQKMANEYINQRIFKNLIRGSMNQPMGNNKRPQNAPGLVVGTVIAKPAKNKVYNIYGQRVRSQAIEEELK